MFVVLTYTSDFSVYFVKHFVILSLSLSLKKMGGNKEETMDEYRILIEKHRSVYSVVTYNM